MKLTHLISSAMISLFLGLVFSLQTCVAQKANQEALKTFMTPDVIGVAYLDLDNTDLDASMELLDKLGFRGTIGYEEMLESLPAIKKDLSDLKDAGLSRAYAMLRTSDIQDRGTSFVIPLKDGSDPEQAKAVLASLLKKYAIDGQIKNRNGVLMVATAGLLERLENNVADDSDDRAGILEAIDGGSFGFVVFGDPDSRRVVAELMPTLPAPFSKLDGPLVAEETKWIGLFAKLDDAPELKLLIEAASEDSAQTYTDLINDGLKVAKFAPQVRDAIPKSEIKFVFDAITPTQSGNRVTISASEITKDFDRLAKIAAPKLKMMRDAAIKAQQMNAVRQLILGMLNYESAYRHFPTQFSADKQGKPLLSWRVHILPFLEHNELYQQFKLDEPWDSEHNLALVEKMPKVYWNMSGEALKQNRAGETIFQVPAGEGLIFNGVAESKFRDLTDGSSNTISLVTMAPAHAVPWTKPVDWNVNLDNPLEQLKAEGRKYVVVSVFDGSSFALPLKMPETWRALIGHQDGEVVDVDLLQKDLQR